MAATKFKRAGVTCVQVAEFLGEQTVSALVASKALRCSKVTILTMLNRDVFTSVSGELSGPAKKYLYPDEIDLWIALKNESYEERVKQLRDYRVKQGRPVQPIKRSR